MNIGLSITMIKKDANYVLRLTPELPVLSAMFLCAIQEQKIVLETTTKNSFICNVPNISQ